MVPSPAVGSSPLVAGMSLRVSVAVIVSEADSNLIEVIKIDTAVNPNPDDQQASVLLAAALVERLVGETGRDAADRLREVRAALENVEHG
jgi:hypothetical protein